MVLSPSFTVLILKSMPIVVMNVDENVLSAYRSNKHVLPTPAQIEKNVDGNRYKEWETARPTDWGAARMKTNANRTVLEDEAVGRANAQEDNKRGRNNKYTW